MTEQELIEQLADQEHAGWARWMDYFLSRCYTLGPSAQLPDGSLVIPGAYVRSLRRQIATPYAELRESEQQLDRDEVARILPIIERYAHEYDQELGV